MQSQDNWVQNVLGIAKASFESSVRTMDTFQHQAEKAIDLALNNVSMLQEEGKRELTAWVENIKKAQKIYNDAVQDGLSKLENQLKTTKHK
jgi:hypothetical protein